MKRLLLLLPLALAACSPLPPSSGGSSVARPAEPFEPAKGQAANDDIARFLAGRPVRHGAALSQIQQSADYQAFAKDMREYWRLGGYRRVSTQKAWQHENLKPLIGSPNTLLYPFGGPDLLYALSMFPSASHYVLLGLEPAGGLPPLETSDSGAVLNALPRLAKSVETQLLYGYFITKDMRNDLTNGPLQGVTPVLLTALALSDATVGNVQNTTAGGNPAIEISFRTAEGDSKKVTYVSGDLSNSGFGGSYRSWISSYSGSVVYFKAASYLMHDAAFTGIRKWVLDNAYATVQDDSGIPYKAYDGNKWNVHLFGSYDGPIGFFGKHNQPDLTAAYEAAGTTVPISFGSGYHMRPKDANIMVSVRK